jgi:AcrR family transcriptional regulator
MNTPRVDAVRTRQRLLAAASEVFAEKGFRDTTIAEICSKAGANNAAVNYHFRNKETLYREAWLQSMRESLKKHPPDGGVASEAPLEERLLGLVKAMLKRITDESNKEFLIVHQEMANPTGLLKDVMKEEIQPLRVRTRLLIRKLLGPHATESQVLFCEISIISQCINPPIVESRWHPDLEQDVDYPRIDDIEAYAHHVTMFSLGGIRAILDKTESKNSPTARQSNLATKDQSKGW